MDDVLDALLKKGKVVTVNVEIANPEQAQRLLGTMYNKHVDEFGIIVQSWARGDLLNVNDIRLALLDNENERHYQTMQRIQYMGMDELLEIDDVDKWRHQ